MSWISRLVAVGLLLGVVSGCSGKNTAPPTSTAAPSVVPTPALVGPVVVYTSSLAPEKEQAAGHPVTLITAYDAGPGRQVSQARIEDRVLPVYDYARSAALFVGHYKDGDEIHNVDLLTGADTSIYTGSKSINPGMAVSPDGQTLAFSEGDVAVGGAEVKLLSLGDNAARTLSTFTSAAPAGFAGTPVPRIWRDDGAAVVVSGDVGSDPGPGSWATITTAGAVTTYPRMDGKPSGDGRLLAVTATPERPAQACESGTISHRVRIFSFDANTDSANIDDPASGLVAVDWSLGGPMLLVASLPVSPSAPCGYATSEAGAQFEILQPLAAPVPAGDLAELRREWFGDFLIPVGCEDASIAPDVFGDCGASRNVLLVNGRRIVDYDIAGLGYLRLGN